MTTKKSEGRVCAVCCTIAILLTSANVFAAETREAIVQRVADDIRFFASDEVEGRGVETKGIELAAERILAEYRKFGLRPAMPDGSYRQSFPVNLGGSEIKTDTAVRLSGPQNANVSLALNDEFQPLRRGVNGAASGGIVFVGYGIQSKEDKYDDYANVDVAGKIAIIIRREPQQGVADGAFDGTETSRHAYIDTKLKLAVDNKAAGVIFVNDPFTATSPAKDELSTPGGFGTDEAGIPFCHVKQSVIDRLLQKQPLTVNASGATTELTSLKGITDYIDKTLQPVSQELKGWNAELTTRFDIKSVTAHNLIGVLDGEGPLAKEVIVVGGHYDHLGFGGYGSRAKNRTGEIHNGADDNASGTAATLEMIRRMASGRKPQRTIVFVCFSGEERGLLGSNYYCRNPVFPLEKTVAMLNFDMIGTLRNNRVEVNGVGTAEEFAAIVDVADDASPLTTKRAESPFAGSDHLPFYRKDIPVMFFFTGVTSRYHTPDDDFETINVDGVASIVDLSETVLRNIDQLPQRPTFQKVGRTTPRRPAFLGVMPNFGADADETGIPIRGVSPGSPASDAGFQTGDIIVGADSTTINSYGDLIKFLRDSKAGQRVEFRIKRGNDAVNLQVILGSPK